MNTHGYRGRIAPTPSGFLHIGHARTFKEAWNRARNAGGKIILRIEDIDEARTRPEYVAQIFADLKKIGLDWDEGPDIGGEFAPYAQSERKEYYKKILQTLIEKKLAYPSDASRADIKKFSKKQANKIECCEAEMIFPQKLRIENFETPENIFEKNWRFRTPDGEKISFFDEVLGKQSFTAGEDFGDFLIWRKSGEPSYELAVVADDIAMRITEVVRGRDLLVSTARQLLIYTALGASPPKFAHMPLITEHGGKKLSKSVLKNDSMNPLLIKNMLQ